MGYELLNKLWCCIDLWQNETCAYSHLSTANNFAEILMVICSLSVRLIINKSKCVLEKAFHSKIYCHRKSKMRIENKLRSLWYSMYSQEQLTLQHRGMECCDKINWHKLVDCC